MLAQLQHEVDDARLMASMRNRNSGVTTSSAGAAIETSDISLGQDVFALHNTEVYHSGHSLPSTPD